VKRYAARHCAATRYSEAFTLLELVIALAIIAVLAAFALPSYHAQAARGHRTDAAAALYRAAQYIESTPRGSGTSGTSGTSGVGGLTTLPAGFDQAPQSGTPVYRLRLLAADDVNGGYTLEATPVDTGPMRDDPCGTFALDATGLRANRTAASTGSTGSTPGIDTVQCWNGR
jgi:type IV pilus assembly protein PilE